MIKNSYWKDYNGEDAVGNSECLNPKIIGFGDYCCQ